MGHRSAAAQALLDQGLKTCKGCQQTLPISNFTLSHKGWHQARCRVCIRLYNREYSHRDPENYRATMRKKYQENRDHYRDLSRRHRYGVPLGTFDLLYEKQGGRCAICGAEKSTRTGRKLALDHCAESGVIRGLLCTPCNQAIGQFRHNEDLLYAAIAYLGKSGHTLDELKVLVENRSG